jgi:hypothetical protein
MLSIFRIIALWVIELHCETCSNTCISCIFLIREIIRKGNVSKKKIEELCNKGKCCSHRRKAGGGVYCLGFIGALVFYIQHASSFAEGVMGLLKAMVWPALLLHKLLGMM